MGRWWSHRGNTLKGEDENSMYVVGKMDPIRVYHTNEDKERMEQFFLSLRSQNEVKWN